MAGERSTIWSGPTRAWAWAFPPIATGPVYAPCRIVCRRSNTTPGEIVRTVSSTRSYIAFKGQMWKVPQAFCGERLAIRPLARDGHYGIFFASWQVGSIDLTRGQTVSDVSEQASAMSPV